MEKLITVCIPAYNEEKNIAETIECVLQGADYIREIIISDNASEDTTGEIVKKYARKNPVISYIRLEKTIHSFRNWINTVNHAKAPYTLIVGAHDLLSPGYFRAVSEAIARDPDAPAVLAQNTSFTVPGEYSLQNINWALFTNGDVKARLYGVLHDWRTCNMCNQVLKTDMWRLFISEWREGISAWDHLVAAMVAMAGKCVLAPDAVFHYRNTHGFYEEAVRTEIVKKRYGYYERETNRHWYIPNEYWRLVKRYAPFLCTKQMKRDIALAGRNQFLSRFTDESWDLFTHPGRMEEYLKSSGRPVFLFGVSNYGLKFYEVMRDRFPIAGIVDPANSSFMRGNSSKMMAVIALPDSAESLTLMDELEGLGFTYEENYWLASDFPAWRDFLSTNIRI